MLMKVYEGMDGDEFRRGVYMQIAAMAYEGYVKYGRGGVLINLPDTEVIASTPTSDIVQQKPTYLTKDNPDLPDGMADEFEKYDPETELILLLQDKTGGIGLS